MPKRIGKEDFEAEVLKSGVPVLTDFYSDSCVPCRRMSPLLYELEEKLGEKLKIVKINVNFDSELAEKYGVRGAPTLILFENGSESRRLSGAVNKNELESFVLKE